jgi:multidrug efflux pump subunit AcrA (membrane-fusion protein)
VTASLFRDQRVIAQPGRPAPAARPRARGTRRRGSARQATGVQRAGGAIIAVACVLMCCWYVRQIASANRDVLTGSVTSTGVLDLNFAAAGVVADVLVHVGQRVRKDQLLATESAPGAAAIAAADAQAVTADREQLDAQTTAVSVASDRAQLARDEARLAADEQAVAQSRIVAPAAGLVTAVDAQPGQTAEPAGIREDVADPAPASPQPLFSLLPLSPQVNVKTGMTGSATLPMIQLRISGSWEVLTLIPESTASSVHAGQAVRVSVPAAGLGGLSGVVREVLATPVATSDGDMYEAIVTIASRCCSSHCCSNHCCSNHEADPPLDGMTANITLLPDAGS